MSEHDEREDYDDERWGDQLAPASAVRWPASAMWACGVLQLLCAQVWVGFVVLLLVLIDLVDDDRTLGEVWEKVRREPALWGTFAVWPVATACAVLVIRGANDLRRFRRYWWAVVAAVLTVFSVPVLCLAVLQVPVGAWVLVVLARRDVRARFEVEARAVTAC
jgi:hypothetical protein